MEQESGPSPVAAWACLIVGLSYIGMGAGSLLMPEAQRSGTVEDFLLSLATERFGFNLLYLGMLLGSIAGLAVVPAIASLGSRTWSAWAKNLGVVGFAVAAVNASRYLAWVPIEVNDYPLLPEDAARYAVRLGHILLSVDPWGVFGFGLVGLFVVISAVTASRLGTIPKALGWVGAISGVCYAMVVAGNYFSQPILVTIAAGLGGVMLAPIFFIWMGRVLMRSGSDQRATADQPLREVSDSDA